MKRFGTLLLVTALLGASGWLTASAREGGANAEGQRGPELLNMPACPKRGAEAMQAVHNMAKKNIPVPKHIVLLCVIEAIKDQEERLKRLEAAKGQ